MKKLISMLLILTLCLPLAACGKKNEGVEASLPSSVQGEDQKILILYYSSANTNSVDVVSAATPYFDGVASTELLAQEIRKLVGGDLVRLTPVQDYPESYNDTADRAKKEQDNGVRPEINVELTAEQLAKYDTVFLGYPVWWYDLPMPMWTFLESVDLSGKTVIPFFSHEGSSDGANSLNTIQTLAKGADVKTGDALSIRGGKVDSSENDVREWVRSLGYSK